MSTDPKGGTTAEELGDAAVTQTAETLTTADANADGKTLAQLQAEIDRLNGVVGQSLAEKTTLEQTKREVAELRARLSAPPTGAAPAQAALLGRLQQHVIAAQQDPGSDSALVVGLFQQNQALMNEVRSLSGLIGTPAEKQQQVRDLQSEYAQRGESISAKTADEILEGRRLKAEAERVSATSREQQAAEEARSRNVVATRTVGVSRQEIEGKTISMADWERKTATMSPAEARAYDRELAKKGIQVTPD